MNDLTPPGPPQPPELTPAARPPHQPRTGWLRLTVQGHVLTSNMIPPRVSLNGHPVPTSYGENILPVYAGPLHIDVVSQWLREFGQASLECEVPAGGTVAVFYAAPLHQFTTGNIGFEKQKRPGVLPVVMGVLVVLLLMVLVVVAGVL